MRNAGVLPKWNSIKLRLYLDLRWTHSWDFQSSFSFLSLFNFTTELMFLIQNAFKILFLVIFPIFHKTENLAFTTWHHVPGYKE